MSTVVRNSNAMRLLGVLALALVLACCLAGRAYAAGDSEQGDLAAGSAADPANSASSSADLEAGAHTAADASAAATPFTGEGLYYIALPSKVKTLVAMKKNSRINNTQLVLAKRKNTNLMKFEIKKLAGGLFTVRNVATGRYLSADPESKGVSGVYMNLGEEAKYRKWNIEVNADGSVSIANAATDTLLSIKGGKAKRGSALALQAKDDAGAQKFKLVKTKKKKNEIVKIKVPCYNQNPQLPTGCESVALTNALRYWGFKLNKTEIARKWMPYGGNGVYNFIGSPYNESGWIICAPGIAQTANKYLNKKDTDVEAVVVKGKSMKKLRTYIDRGYPVVVWTTIGMRSPGSVQAVKSGYPLRSNNHAVVLCGYNPKTGKYQVSDSLAGKVWRDGKRFTRLYNLMGKQGVVLTNG